MVQPWHTLVDRSRGFRTRRALHRRLGGQQPVLVFSLAKVGTTSLHRVLESQLQRPSVHCHHIAAFPEFQLGPASTTARTTSASTWRGDYIRRRLDHDPDARWDVVCGVRDPLARHVSAVFHLADRDPGSAQGGWDGLTHRVQEGFRAGSAGLDWFDVELREVTGVDVFAEPFPTSTGFHIYEQGRFRVLLVRFEDINRVGPDALSTFFSIDVDAIPRANAAAGKSYGSDYRDFQEHAVIAEDVLDLAYDSPLAQHFYRPDEREAFRARWRTDSGSTTT